MDRSVPAHESVQPTEPLSDPAVDVLVVHGGRRPARAPDDPQLAQRPLPLSRDPLSLKCDEPKLMESARLTNVVNQDTANGKG